MQLHIPGLSSFAAWLQTKASAAHHSSTACLYYPVQQIFSTHSFPCYVETTILNSISLLCWNSPTQLSSLLCWNSPTQLISLFCWISPTPLISLLCWNSPTPLISLLCWNSPTPLISLSGWKLKQPYVCSFMFSRIFQYSWRTFLQRSFSKIRKINQKTINNDKIKKY